jgi:dTDP-4-amino-4,6-dideoxygalactose transaminase
VSQKRSTIQDKRLDAFLFDEEEEQEVLDVIRSKRIESTVGTKSQAFAEAIGDYLGVAHVTIASSGTTALQLALAAAGIGPGDEVIVPAISSLATPNAVLHQNGVPVFADVDPRTLTLDPEDAARRVTPRTKAIVAVHLYGCPADLAPLLALAEENGARLVEDCALAMGAEYRGHQVGTVGHLAEFSFGTSKQICIGQGGAVVTNDDALGARAAKLNHHYGIRRPGHRIGRADGLGFNYKLSEVAAALGLAQLRKLERINAQRIANAATLTAALQDLDGRGIRLPHVPPEVKHVFNEYLLLLDEAQLGRSRDEVWRMLTERGIDADPFFDTPMYLEPAYLNQVGYGEGCPFACAIYRERGGRVEYGPGLCPTAEDVTQRALAITPHPGLTPADLDLIAGTLRELVA